MSIAAILAVLRAALPFLTSALSAARKYALPIIAAAAIAVAYWQGHRAGAAQAEASYQAAELKASRDAAAALARANAEAEAARHAATAKEAARLKAERDRDMIAREMEDLANAQPINRPDCLPVDRVRRLNGQ